MTFLSTEWLWLLAVVGALGLAYLLVQWWGRRRYTVRFTNLDLLASVAPKRPGWRRHIPAALLLLALASMAVAMARPTRAVDVPRERATIIMAIDVSISMDATDVLPTRLEAAKAAATAFTEQLPKAINLGLVAFAGTAAVLVPPSTDHEAVSNAVARLQLAEATAIGEAVLASIRVLEAMPQAPGGEPVPATVVLMSDGETTVGTPTDVAAEAAQEAGIPVTTIAFGTATGTIEYQGELVQVPVNVEELAGLADVTGGSAFEAVTAEELRSVYADIGSSVGFEKEDREVGTWFVGGAFALAGLAALGSLLWFSRLP